MDFLFKKTKELEIKVDNFHNFISESAILFVKAIEHFVDNKLDRFEESYKQLSEMEHDADDLRKDIETRLYTESLIPDARGDVLGILESMDNVIDSAKHTISYFSIEKPKIPEYAGMDFVELASTSRDAVEELVLASRAFFRDFMSVKDHIHKVNFYEGQADKIADRLKRNIFSSDIDLAKKNQLRFFVTNVESLSDLAEDVSEKLAIYTIKRSL